MSNALAATTLLTLKGFLLCQREELNVGYDNYLSAIDRRLNNEHRTEDVQALVYLREEMCKQYFQPRSPREALLMEQFVTCLNTVIKEPNFILKIT